MLALRTDSAEEDDRYLNISGDAKTQLLINVIKGDQLRIAEKEERSHADRFILLAAKLISPVIEPTYSVGCDWCIDAILSTPHTHLTAELEISKAITFLKSKDFSQATAILKTFEKKESRLLSTAAANLAFLYILEGQFATADKYADIAISADRYNANALVNKGNCLFMNGEYDKARDLFQDAVDVEASCTEAVFNLGLTYKKQGSLEDALDCFLKLHTILRYNSEVLFQIAHLYELLNDNNQACEWYGALQSILPNDPSIYVLLGALFEKDGDKSLAFQNYSEAYRLNPSDINVITWMGAYYIESQFCEKAIEYFLRAAIVQPVEVKWRLMVASCYRRIGNYQQAMDAYKAIHADFPENVECLRFLVRLCTDMGLSDVQDFATRLKRVEKSKEANDQRKTSAEERKSSARSGSGRRLSSSGARRRGPTDDSEDANNEPKVNVGAFKTVPEFAAPATSQPPSVVTTFLTILSTHVTAHCLFVLF